MRLCFALSLIVLAATAACSGPAATPDGAHENMVSAEPAPLDPAAPEEEKAALASCSPVTVEGYCGVSFGMTPAEATRKFPVKLERYDGSDGDTQADANHCFEMFAAEPVQGVTFMVENQKVGRVDFLTEAAKTAEGFGIGSAAADIKTKFAAAAAETPNKYEPEVLDLTVTRGLTKFVFEIQDGKVRGWRAGIAPTIDYTEHCG
ncbi:MAG: hypothetical protein QM773_06080 [Hyphomonadaceae bacterium]